MKLRQFKGERNNEIAMIRVAKAVLEEKGEVMDFEEIVREVVNFIGMSKKEEERRLAQFYTDINVDGEFISLGENKWGLRNWYPVDSINEVLTHENEAADIIPTVSPDGFDEYEDAALEEEFKDELDGDEEKTAPVEGETFVDIDGDGTVENLDDYQDDVVDIDSDGLDDAELDDLAIVDEDEIDADEEDEDF